MGGPNIHPKKIQCVVIVYRDPPRRWYPNFGKPALWCHPRDAVSALGSNYSVQTGGAGGIRHPGPRSSTRLLLVAITVIFVILLIIILCITVLVAVATTPPQSVACSKLFRLPQALASDCQGRIEDQEIQRFPRKWLGNML